MTQTAAATECLPLRDRLARERGRVWVVGHRGAMGHCPENTLASFERGLQLGADWIELDVHLSRDNALIVIHDETLDRTTNGQGAVREHSLAELKALDAGSWFGPEYAGEPIPTLDEVLGWLNSGLVGTNIDQKLINRGVTGQSAVNKIEDFDGSLGGPIKKDKLWFLLYYAGIEAAVVEALDRYGMTEQVIVISFDHRTVQRVKTLDPRIATGVLYSGRPVDGGVSLAAQAQADAILPHWAHVTAADVAGAHSAGLSVAPWASSDPAVLRGLIDAGVDAIGTNHPDVLRDVMKGARG